MTTVSHVRIILTRRTVVACYAGLALDGNFTSPAELEPFVQDCLNQIEFIEGPADSEWGAP
jgi:alpha-N-arabinofuranosidase